MRSDARCAHTQQTQQGAFPAAGERHMILQKTCLCDKGTISPVHPPPDKVCRVSSVECRVVSSVECRATSSRSLALSLTLKASRKQTAAQQVQHDEQGKNLLLLLLLLTTKTTQSTRLCFWGTAVIYGRGLPTCSSCVYSRTASRPDLTPSKPF